MYDSLLHSQWPRFDMRRFHACLDVREEGAPVARRVGEAGSWGSLGAAVAWYSGATPPPESDAPILKLRRSLEKHVLVSVRRAHDSLLRQMLQLAPSEPLPASLLDSLRIERHAPLLSDPSSTLFLQSFYVLPLVNAFSN